MVSLKAAPYLDRFPVLIAVPSDSGLAAYAQEDGQDIFFTASDDTKLPHEIEQFDGTTGELIAWVQILELSDADTVIHMYYGNLGAADQRTPTAVWDSSFVSVHHMTTYDSSELKDSTVNEYDLVPSGSPDFVVESEGGIGVSARVSGKAPFATYGDGFTLDADGDQQRDENGQDDIERLDQIQRMTMSAWIKMDRLDVDIQGVLGKNLDLDAPGWSMNTTSTAFPYGQGMIGVWLGRIAVDGSGQGVTTQNAGVIQADRLHYWVAVFDGTQAVNQRVRVYIDGDALPTDLYGNGPAARTPPTVNPVRIATAPMQDVASLVGTIDEVRFSDTNRSADWIATEYSNQNDPTGFVDWSAPPEPLGL